MLDLFLVYFYPRFSSRGRIRFGANEHWWLTNDGFYLKIWGIWHGSFQRCFVLNVCWHSIRLRKGQGKFHAKDGGVKVDGRVLVVAHLHWSSFVHLFVELRDGLYIRFDQLWDWESREDERY